jgi:hypothetical protein
MSIMEELIRLEQAFEQLARRWEAFVGHEPGSSAPRQEDAVTLEQRVRQLGLRDGVSPVERVRLQQLASQLAVKAASWRRLPPQAPSGPSAPARPKSPTTPPAASAPQGAKPQVGEAALEEYRRLFARYQAVVERAGEPIPVNFARFVQELEEQRQRLTARGLHVEGFDVVREPSGVRVRPRTRVGGRT